MRAFALFAAVLMGISLVLPGCTRDKMSTDPAADIQWVDPVVKYIVYATYLGYADFYKFCEENSVAESAQYESQEKFYDFVELFDEYIEKNKIRVTESFLKSISSVLLYRISDGCAVEFHFNDAELESTRGRGGIVGLPLGINIQSLEDFAHMSELESLDIRFSVVSDLSALEGLTKLNTFWILSPNLTDLSPLLRYPALTHVRFNGEAISDFSPLSELNELEALRMVGVDAPQLSFLKGMTGLKTLSFQDSSNIDLNEMVKYCHPQLSCLEMDACLLRDLEPLGSLTQLEVLELPRNRITDITPLSKLTRLKRLYMPQNQISDISPLSRLYELQDIDVYDNYVCDISALSNLKELRKVDLSFNCIVDFSPLDELDKSNREVTHTSNNPRA